jgi:hypothetical protein
VHLGSKKTRGLLADLGKRETDWLHKGAALMVKAATADWLEWGGKTPPTRKATKKKTK